MFLMIYQDYPCNKRSYGSSNISLMRTKNCTASLPSTIRWSYDNAKYIIGRTSIESSGITTARFTILCIPRIPTCGAFKIGVDNIEPKIRSEEHTSELQ